MSTTTTPATVSYTDDRGVIRLVEDWREIAAARDTGPSLCGGCGETFPTLEDLFGHACAASTGIVVPDDVALVPADTPDRTRPQGDGTGSRRPAESATEAQINYVTRLREERDYPTIQHAINAMGARWTQTCPHGGITKAQASQLIEWLKGEAPVAKPEPQAPAKPCRTNRYAGQCRHCGQHVAAEAGLLCKSASGWEVEHNGPCPEAEAPAAAPVPVVPAGHYAIDSTGHNDLAFYRVDHVTEGKWAGATFVKLVVGGHPDRNVRRDAVAGILARIAEVGPQAAAERYGREIGRCGRCNRELTDAESRALGIGPTCREMAW